MASIEEDSQLILKLDSRRLSERKECNHKNDYLCNCNEAKYGDTMRLKGVLRQTRSAQIQCHLPPPA